MKSDFNKLDGLLSYYEALWKPPAFTSSNDSRLEKYPDISNWINSLTEQEIDQIQVSDRKLLESAAPFFHDAADLLALTSAPSKKFQGLEIELPPFWNRDLPGRKASQIQAFTAALWPFTTPILDWCCGKLHLGRLISEVSGQKVSGLEINPSLVEQAKQYAKKRKLTHQVDAHQCDALSTQASHFLCSHQHVIALHACGGLHTKMLESSIQERSSRISVSPCCYHRFNHSELYIPLSSEAKQSRLRLSNEDLRIATRQCNIASRSETQKRKLLQTWRLGFDALQRELRQVDEYLPCPSLSNTVLQKGFQVFCEEMAALKGLALPGSLDYLHYLKQGEHSFVKYQQIELVRMLFRRALELWLVLDRAMFLEENGYRCDIFEFCESSVSPRNLMIDAKLAL